MAVNELRMLPGLSRNMSQMKDLLQAEQGFLDELLQIIQEMIEDESLYTQETVTKERLELLVETISGMCCEVEEIPEEVKIILHLLVEDKDIRNKKVLKLLEEFVPAHLVYVICYRLLIQILNRNMMNIEKVICSSYFIFQWSEDGTLDGSFLLNGKTKLDAALNSHDLYSNGVKTGHWTAASYLMERLS